MQQSSVNWRNLPGSGKAQVLQRIRQQKAAILAANNPRNPLPLMAWAQQHRRIQDRATGRVGPFSLADYPWLADLYGHADAPRIVIRKGAQLGVTEYNVTFALWAIAEMGLTVFFALPPGGNTVGDFSHQRVRPAVVNTPVLAAKSTGVDNVGLKMFETGALYVRGTNIVKGDPRGAPQLASVPADVIIFDEFDRIPPAAIPLVRDRKTDSRYGWERDNSTPTVPGFGIDAEYQHTDMREPHVCCAACGEWRRTDMSLLKAPGLLVCPCGARLDMAERWAAAAVKYIPQAAGVGLIGYWIPGLLSPRADHAKMWQRMNSSDPEEVQAFWNNDMGMAYEPQGAKLTEALLDACRRDYTFPARLDGASAAMGVDVQGAELHVYVKARWHGENANGERVQRALWIGTVPDFADLDSIIARYGVACCVIDAMPESHSARAFAGKYPGRVFLARFVQAVDGNRMATFHMDTQAAHIDRTKAILTSHNHIEQQVDELPHDWRMIDDFLAQMTVNIRVRMETATGQAVYKFPKSGRPDHFDLAKAYCEVAMDYMTGGGSQPLSAVEQPMMPSRFAGTVHDSGGQWGGRSERGSRWR